MGLVLDSSIIIAAERRGDSRTQLIQLIASTMADQEVVLSAVGLTEIVHAIYRASVPRVRIRREQFIQELLTDVEVLPYTRSTAMIAGRIDGEQRSAGITIPSVDVLIGATALEVGYSVLTVNVRDFQRIPGLRVLTL